MIRCLSDRQKLERLRDTLLFSNQSIKSSNSPILVFAYVYSLDSSVGISNEHSAETVPGIKYSLTKDMKYALTRDLCMTTLINPPGIGIKFYSGGRFIWS